MGEEANVTNMVQLMDNLDWPQAIKEMVIAEKYLRHEGSPKVGSIGFCMGE